MQSQTKDIYLAAALLTLGYNLQEVSKKEPKHQVFVFEINPSIFKQIELELANEKLVVNLAKFKNSLQRMKSIVHSS